ncbi:hypothetical protein ACFW4X_14875 [Streptomyces smyrnaeus]|nr:hypothetical protein [Streptomyces smyrnaeus]
MPILLGTATCAVATALCALAPHLGALIAVVGVGGGAVSPSA